MSNIRSFSVDEAIAIVGEGFYPSLSGRHVDKKAWNKFVENNVDTAFIERAIALFQQIDEVTLEGLDTLCEYVAKGVEPNRMVAGSVISCRIAPHVRVGTHDDIGRLSVGTCWDNGWKLILNTQGRDLALTWGWGKGNFSKALTKDTFDKAGEIVEGWGDRIVGKPALSAAKS